MVILSYSYCAQRVRGLRTCWSMLASGRWSAASAVVQRFFGLCCSISRIIAGSLAHLVSAFCRRLAWTVEKDPGCQVPERTSCLPAWMSARFHSGILVYLERSCYLWHRRSAFADQHSLGSFAPAASGSLASALAPPGCLARPSGPGSEAVSFKTSPGAHV